MCRIFLILFFVLNLSACTSTLYTYGSKSANFATLKGPYHIDLIAIDGDLVTDRPGCTGPVCTKGFEIYFDEGVHTIDVKLATGHAYTDVIRLEFYAEANEFYEFKHSEMDNKVIHNDGSWRPVIVNKSTNRAVSH